VDAPVWISLARPFRQPALIAKMAETFDRLSRGRLILALSADQVGQNPAAFGLLQRDAAEKVQAPEEAIDIMRGLWSHSRLCYIGKRSILLNASLEPKPMWVIPIWLGGHGARTLDLVGRNADGWLPALHYVAQALGREPRHLSAMPRRVRQTAAAAGCDPEAITYAVNVAR
jgi:alkanesulfonate monooxygenase SsuD/methylene tetrahydromethanopterin reductase-like flavin-dependent oxidoreductase (luciferase family)